MCSRVCVQCHTCCIRASCTVAVPHNLAIITRFADTVMWRMTLSRVFSLPLCPLSLAGLCLRFLQIKHTRAAQQQQQTWTQAQIQVAVHTVAKTATTRMHKRIWTSTQQHTEKRRQRAKQSHKHNKQQHKQQRVWVWVTRPSREHRAKANGFCLMIRLRHPQTSIHSVCCCFLFVACCLFCCVSVFCLLCCLCWCGVLHLCVCSESNANIQSRCGVFVVLSTRRRTT